MLKKVNLLLANKWFPVSFRIVTLLAFVGLVIIGFSTSSKDPVFLRQLSRTNLTTSFVWRLWWPMIILSSIIFGRLWCMVCPVEMITTFFSKIGLRLKRPRWILSGWGITVFYTIIVIFGVKLLQMEFNPIFTASYLLFIVGISIVSGFIFEKNTFCRYLCPVGYVLSIFSKMAVWGWRVKKKSVCDACSDKSCLNSNYTYRLNYKSCGVDLIPAEIDNNNHCILCAGCLKSCKTYKTNSNPLRPNPALMKIGFANDLLKVKPLLIAECVFLFILSAHLIDEITEFQLITKMSFSFITKFNPHYLSTNPSLGKDLIGVGFLFFLFPIILWILPYLLTVFARMKISFISYLKDFCQIYVPLIIALFSGAIIMEITTKIPYYKYIVHDLSGVRTIQGILTRQIVLARPPEWTQWALIINLILVMVLGVIISFKVIRKLTLKFKIEDKKAILYSLPFLFILLFFSEVLVYQYYK